MLTFLDGVRRQINRTELFWWPITWNIQDCCFHWESFRGHFTCCSTCRSYWKADYCTKTASEGTRVSCWLKCCRQLWTIFTDLSVSGWGNFQSSIMRRVLIMMNQVLCTYWVVPKNIFQSVAERFSPSSFPGLPTLWTLLCGILRAFPTMLVQSLSRAKSRSEQFSQMSPAFKTIPCSTTYEQVWSVSTSKAFVTFWDV